MEKEKTYIEESKTKTHNIKKNSENTEKPDRNKFFAQGEEKREHQPLKVWMEEGRGRERGGWSQPEQPLKRGGRSQWEAVLVGLTHISTKNIARIRKSMKQTSGEKKT